MLYSVEKIAPFKGVNGMDQNAGCYVGKNISNLRGILYLNKPLLGDTLG